MEPNNSYYTVVVYDNYHYHDSKEAYEISGFPSSQEAVAKCQQIVDENLANFAEPGRSAEQIYQHYKMFGDNPAVLSPNGAPPVDFSGWDYAKANAHRFVQTA